MSIRFPGSEGDALADEMSEIDLGDVRLNMRFAAMVRSMAETPAASFSGMCGSEAEREGFYRLLRNPRVESEAILEPHIVETVSRSRRNGRRVLVVHDTTTFEVDSEAELESYLTPKKRGFRGHFSLAIDERSGDPLGVCGVEIVLRKNKKSRLKKNNKRMSGNQTAALKDKESERWFRAVEQTASRLDGLERLHVMDREGDSYTLLSSMVQSGEDFVVRVSQNRRVSLSNDDEARYLNDLLDAAKPFKRTLRVDVSKRKAKRAPKSAKANPSRDGRSAELELSYARVTIKRPVYLGSPHLEQITLNVVRAVETNPPDGAGAIEWKIFTTLDVKTKADVENILSIYTKRWMIEEYFRALKSGCGMDKRHLRNTSSILNSIAAFIPIAWRALWLRHRVRENNAEPATCSFSTDELTVLRLIMKPPAERFPENPTVHQALMLVAEYGGHRRRSGLPGWKTLTNGFAKLLPRVDGWQMAQNLS